MKKSFGVVKTTAIGGLVFLLPLIVIGILIGELIPIILSIASLLNEVLYPYFPEWLKNNSAWGYALLVFAAIDIVLLILFVAGMAARRTIGQYFSQKIERVLTLFFPKYLIIKQQMTGTLDHEDSRKTMKPVLIEYDDFSEIAFETSRLDNGKVALYLPGSPDPWSGRLIFMNSERVQPLFVDFPTALTAFETLGRDAANAMLLTEPGSSEKSGSPDAQ